MDLKTKLSSFKDKIGIDVLVIALILTTVGTIYGGVQILKQKITPTNNAQLEPKLKLYLTADDKYKLYLNGSLVGSTNDETWQWAEAEEYLLPIKEGKNVLAVEVTNTGGPGGLFGEGFYHNGKFSTDSGWIYSTNLKQGWQSEDFNDSDWDNSSEVGKFKTYPWSDVRGLESKIPTAKWIWKNSNDNSGKEVVYFRYSFDYYQKIPPKIFMQATPRKGSAPLKTAFVAKGYDLDGSVTEFSWNFGDGNYAQGESVSHTYEKEGAYNVKLMAKDNFGLTASDNKTVIVSSATQGKTFFDDFNTLDENEMRWLKDKDVYSDDGFVLIPINNKLESVEQYRYARVTANFNNPGETDYEGTTPERGDNLYQYHMLRLYIDDNNLIYINTQRNKVHVSAKKNGKEYYTTGGIVSDVTGFHDYTIDWKPGSIDFYLDGNLLTTVEGDYVMDDFATIQLITSPDKFSEPMELDSVKVERYGK